MDPDVLEPLLQHTRILSSILRLGDCPPMPLGAFSDLETDLRESMDRLRACPYRPIATTSEDSCWTWPAAACVR
jgi:hypothetical protein